MSPTAIVCLVYCESWIVVDYEYFVSFGIKILELSKSIQFCFYTPQYAEKWPYICNFMTYSSGHKYFVNYTIFCKFAPVHH